MQGKSKYTTYLKSSPAYGVALEDCAQVAEQGYERRAGRTEEGKITGSPAEMGGHSSWARKVKNSEQGERRELRGWRVFFFFSNFLFLKLFIGVIQQLQSVNPAQALAIIAAGGLWVVL